jgi:hypothetical protein
MWPRHEQAADRERILHDIATSYGNTNLNLKLKSALVSNTCVPLKDA